ncbi:MAG: hypothetical protein QM529_01395 [Hydrotalea sp.]|nr:hypothetical protein [Hydrotalea sp.]
MGTHRNNASGKTTIAEIILMILTMSMLGSVAGVAIAEFNSRIDILNEGIRQDIRESQAARINNKKFSDTRRQLQKNNERMEADMSPPHTMDGDGEFENASLLGRR